MKTRTIILSFILMPFLGVSQDIAFGFNLGVNFNSLELEKDLSLSAEIEELTTNSTTGFHVGIHSLINIASRVKISPQALLAFSSTEFGVNFGNDEQIDQKTDEVRIRIPVDLHLELLTGANSLYLIGGVEYNANIATDNEMPDAELSVKDAYWSARLGLGFRKDFSRFSVSPELTFAKSFDNIEDDNAPVINQVVTNLDNSIVGLNLKFQGLLSN